MAALFHKTEPTRRPWDATILLQVHRLAATRPWRLPSAVYRGCTFGRGNWRDSQAGGGPSGTGSELKLECQAMLSPGDYIRWRLCDEKFECFKAVSLKGDIQIRLLSSPTMGGRSRLRQHEQGLYKCETVGRELASFVSTDVAPCRQMSR